MRKYIHLKGAVIGGFIVVLVACALGAVGETGCDEYDRFELVTTTNFVFLLDRATGQVWAFQVEYSDNVLVTLPHTAEEFFAPKTYDVEPVEPGQPRTR